MLYWLPCVWRYKSWKFCIPLHDFIVIIFAKETDTLVNAMHDLYRDEKKNWTKGRSETTHNRNKTATIDFSRNLLDPSKRTLRHGRNIYACSTRSELKLTLYGGSLRFRPCLNLFHWRVIAMTMQKKTSYLVKIFSWVQSF